MIKVLLLDADGVLLNGEMFSRLLERDYGITNEQVQPFFRGIFTEATVGKADLKEIIQPYLKEWKWKGTVDDFLQYWFRAEHKIDEQLVEYAQKLRVRGIRCYIATNQEKYRAQYILEEIGFSSKFDGLFVSYELGTQKPLPDYYEKVYEKLQPISKSEILFWDDSLSHVEAAKEFGIKAELYKNFKDFEEKMKRYV